MSLKNIFTSKKNNVDVKTIKIGGKKKGNKTTLKSSTKDYEVDSLLSSSGEDASSEFKGDNFNLNSELGIQSHTPEGTLNTEQGDALSNVVPEKFDIRKLEITIDPLDFDNKDEGSSKVFDEDNFSSNYLSSNSNEDQQEPNNEFTNQFDIPSDSLSNTKDFEKEDKGFTNEFTFGEMSTFTDDSQTTGSDEFVTSFDELTKSVTNDSLSPVTSWTEANYNIPSINQENTKKKKSLKEQVFSFTSLPTKQQYSIFISALVLGVVGMGSSIYLNKESSNEEAHASAVTSTLWGDTLKLNASFSGTLLGAKGSYQEMVKTWAQIELNKKELDSIIPNLDNTRINEDFTSITMNLEKVAKNVAAVKSQETVLQSGVEKIEEVRKNIEELKFQLNKLGIIYIQSGATQNELSDIYSLNAAFDSLESSVTAILTSENVTQEDLANLRSSKDNIATLLAEIKDGSESKNVRKLMPSTQHIYNKLSTNWLETIPVVFEVIQASNDLKNVKSLGRDNQLALSKLNEQLRSLINELPGSDETNKILNNYLLTISLLFILISLLALFYVYKNEKEKSADDAKEEAEKQKVAIFKLINEITPIRDGILTQKATLEDGITFDIAKSVNETVDSLSNVVRRIKESSGSMELKTSEIYDLSESMISQTEKQAEQISKAGSSVIQISRAINDIAEKTKQTLDTASLSAEATHKGAEQVKSSVQTMNTISENMQETVSLMKKVSDSSQQISEVIDLLSDITEETNILALNAAVQAAKAGEAGKGFKIVADSIQSLADNAADATRRVGALVATVQTDIQSVGSSIEKTNTEIDKGVSLSVTAGELLNEIDQINSRLTKIVASVTGDAKVNSETAKSIANDMEKILKITEETKDSTAKTAESIRGIANISTELNQSVQSFIVD